MNVLITDDCVSTVNMIRETVSWGKFGIQQVYTAHNIQQAKEVFQSVNIDIILCDLEMPKGSGIELLQWLRENSYKTVSIILTCHAQFNYARKAIELECFEYILKPASVEEVEAVLKRAVDRIKNEKNISNYINYGEHWINNQALVFRNFWSDLLTRNISGTDEQIRSIARKRNVDFSSEKNYMLILASIKRQGKKCIDDPLLLEFALINIASETILGHLDDNAILSLEKYSRKYLVLVINENDQSISSREDFEKRSRLYVNTCQELLDCSLCCYYSDYTKGSLLSETFEALVNTDINNVSCRSGVSGIRSLSHRQTENFNPELVEMKAYPVQLISGNTSEIINSIAQWLTKLEAEDKISVNVLKIFQHDFLQMLYSVLRENGILAHELLRDEVLDQLYMEAGRSVEGMIKWVSSCVTRSADYISLTKGFGSITAKTKRFIQNNYEKDISSNDIASHVYLNQDYLSRVFKKETGVTPMEYLTDIRIKKSMVLLKNKDIPISDVALMVGYNSFSYFSHTFKKAVGKSPIKFRKTN